MSLTFKPTILIIDDSPDVINLISGLLKHSYKVKVATCGEKGLKIAQNDQSIDLILLDVMMPGISGYEVCVQLKADANTSEIPVIFITAISNLDDELMGLNLGGLDYITKPISPAILLARVENYLKIKAANNFLKNNSAFIEAEIHKRSKQQAGIEDIAILILTALAETPDYDQRTTLYIKALAEQLKKHPSFKKLITEQAQKIISDDKNVYFDPDIMSVFIALADNFREIAQRYPDE
jgi:putative two-component system response regulator